MSATRSRRRTAKTGLVQAEAGIVGMTVVTLLVSLAGLWFSHELKDTTERVRGATVNIQSSVDAYKKAMKSTETAVVLITDEGTKSDNKKVEETANKAVEALINAERDTKDCITLLDQVMKLLSTYETTTVTFAGCSLIFALFVIIRQFKL
ncbi:MAG: hypothetical protein RLZ70_1078 [Verrucomicrobiota bacterium]|jgi:hypothetical protein